MSAIRIIARLDVKGDRLIKGIHLEGWRFLGDPHEYSTRYYKQGIDEIIYIDAVASLYSREMIREIVRKTTGNVFVPITVGGGIRSVEDAWEILRTGADKVAVNTQAIKTPEIITRISKKFGKQCMVASIQAKRNKEGKWEAYFDCARENSGREVVEWARELERLGAGEILLTSVDHEGTQKGFETDLIGAVTRSVNIPVIVSGGFGKVDDFMEAVEKGGADAVAIAHNLHYNITTVGEIREAALKKGLEVRS